jgi:hypothetical protein
VLCWRNTLCGVTGGEGVSVNGRRISRQQSLWREPFGRPLGLPDWPGLKRVASSARATYLLLPCNFPVDSRPSEQFCTDCGEQPAQLRRFRDTRRPVGTRVAKWQRLIGSGNMPRKQCVGPFNPKTKKRSKPTSTLRVHGRKLRCTASTFLASTTVRQRPGHPCRLPVTTDKRLSHERRRQ